MKFKNDMATVYSISFIGFFAYAMWCAFVPDTKKWEDVFWKICQLITFLIGMFLIYQQLSEIPDRDGLQQYFIDHNIEPE